MEIIMIELVFEDHNGEVVTKLSITKEQFDKLKKEAESTDISLNDYIINLILNGTKDINNG